VATNNDPLLFTCDLADASVPFPHFWEHTVGSDHAVMALRADWQQQLSRCAKELGFKHVRFHGLLSDDMYTLVQQDNELIYSFFNIDQVFDFLLLSINVKPFVELSFMPSAISSGTQTVFSYKANIDPPNDYNAWATLINKLVTHLVDRYGLPEVSQWFFEVWNEPNLPVFWGGSQVDYFKLYSCTAAAVKSVDSSLKVGGPATAANAWIPEFISFCKEHNTPLDFITTHHYPTDAFGQPGDDAATKLSKSIRSVLRDQAGTVHAQADGLPVYYTEWGTSAYPFDDLHDQPYAAAFIIKTVMEARGLVAGYSYWACSDIFTENYLSSIPFHGGFGLLNIHGIPKPAYHAFALLHRLGNEFCAVLGHHPTVDAWAIRNNNSINIIITNWALPLHDIQTELVTLKLTGIAEIKAIFIERIDDEHANAVKIWQDMGSLGALSAAQVAAINAASLLTSQPFTASCSDGTAFVSLSVPPQGVACLTIELV
jgi:xylan 1,4-beta-xylosidase